MRSSLVVASILSFLGTCFGQSTSLTTASVQAAVNEAVAWTQTAGSIAVVGIRELPGQNAATADLQFNNFQYNADFMKVPKPKNERTPSGNPAVVYIPPSATRNVVNYSGQGVASMTHYTDGRWVLTRIDFNFVQITSTIPVTTSSALPQPRAPAVSTTLTAASVQAAVNQAVAWTQTGGSVAVAGVREVPAQNEATADLQFNNFQYNADFMNIPKPKSERTPAGDPAVVYIPPSASRNISNYSGRGIASMTHYTDGRWVLTRIDFNFVQITSSILVTASGTSSTQAKAPSRAPTEAALLGKWYPTDSVPRALRCGIEFISGGQMRCFPYRFVDGSERPDKDPNKGTWSIQSNVLHWDSSAFPIVRLTQDELVLDIGGGTLVSFSRNRGQLAPF